MFEEQNKNSGVEDILASTEAPGSAPQNAGPLGPPSALAGGKLQPVQNGGSSSAVPVDQMSSPGHSGFPIKKIIALAVMILTVGGAAAAGYFWWQGRSQGGAVMPLGQPSNQVTPPAAIAPPVDNNAPAQTNPLNQALDQFQQDSINKAIDPFNQSPEGDSNIVPPPQNSAATTDTDQDGLNDADEAVNGTNPRLIDSDGDGLSDWEEVTVFGTNALNSDTDGDTFSDGSEVQNGYNPNGPGKLLDFEQAKKQVQ